MVSLTMEETSGVKHLSYSLLTVCPIFDSSISKMPAAVENLSFDAPVFWHLVFMKEAGTYFEAISELEWL